jgi:hypothetical protein
MDVHPAKFLEGDYTQNAGHGARSAKVVAGFASDRAPKFRWRMAWTASRNATSPGHARAGVVFVKDHRLPFSRDVPHHSFYFGFQGLAPWEPLTDRAPC